MLEISKKCTIRVAKAKALISLAVTAKLICLFVFAYADCWFSHGAAQMYMMIDENQDWPENLLWGFPTRSHRMRLNSHRRMARSMINQKHDVK